MTIRSRPGVTLLEVVIAIAIIGIAGIGAVTLVAESWRAVGTTREVERSLRDASAFLEAVALWPREDLDRHLGARAQGPWTMHVDRAAPTLYTVALADSAGGPPLVVTVLFRPELRHAMR